MSATYPWVSTDEPHSYSVSGMIYATLNIDEDISEVFENRRIVNDHQGL
jgi:hypothetical protein